MDGSNMKDRPARPNMPASIPSGGEMLNNKMKELAAIWGYDLQEEFYAISINGLKYKFKFTRDGLYVLDCVGWGPEWLNVNGLIPDLLKGKVRIIDEVEQEGLF